MEQGTSSGQSDFPPKKLARQLDFTTSYCGGPPPPVAGEAAAAQQLPPPLPAVPILRPSIPISVYCKCFASGFYCDGCNCANCCNNVENDAARHEAVEATLEHNPNAFRPKIGSSPHAIRDNTVEAGERAMVGKHNKGCHCKKSGCPKTYCECFQAYILCSENCKCIDCKNFEGSEERKALFHGEHGNSLTYMQQAANAVLNGAIGPSGYGSPASKKRKNQELFYATSVKDQPVHRLAPFPQASHLKTAGPSSTYPSVSIARAVNPAPLGSSKVTYRSLLADIVQQEDAKELCKLLVLVSGEAAKSHSDKKVREEKLAVGGEQTESSLSSNHVRDESPRDPEAQKASADNRSCGTHVVKASTEESGSDSAGGQKGGRPMSPGTLALMCNEQDTMFMASRNPTTSPRFPQNQSVSEAYADQERGVLTAFRDSLLKLINCGRMKELSQESIMTSSTIITFMRGPSSFKALSLETGSSHQPAGKESKVRNAETEIIQYMEISDKESELSEQVEPQSPDSTERLENELFESFVEFFYKILKSRLTSILKGLKTRFSYKKILLRHLDSIQVLGGRMKARPYELLLEEFEKKVLEWYNLIHRDPDFWVQEETANLIRQTEEARFEAEEKIRTLHREIQQLKSKEDFIKSNTEFTNQELVNIKSRLQLYLDNICKHQEIIAKAQVSIDNAKKFIEKLQPEISSLELKINAWCTEIADIQISEHKKSEELEKTTKKLEQFKKFTEKELRKQAKAKAIEKRNYELAQLENKLRDLVDNPL